MNSTAPTKLLKFNCTNKSILFIMLSFIALIHISYFTGGNYYGHFIMVEIILFPVAYFTISHNSNIILLSPDKIIIRNYLNLFRREKSIMLADIDSIQFARSGTSFNMRIFTKTGSFFANFPVNGLKPKHFMILLAMLKQKVQNVDAPKVISYNEFF